MDVVNLDVSEAAKDLAREMTDEERALGLPCFVRHEAAGGHCERPAEMLVYGLRFCEVHGEEARIGALSEFYFDAQETIERYSKGYVPLENDEARHLLGVVENVLKDRDWKLVDEEEDALVRAYPEIPELVCLETRAYDYSVFNEEHFPDEAYSEARRTLHALMRRAYDDGLVCMVEQLEIERESVSAQVSFAVQDRKRKVEAMKAG